MGKSGSQESGVT